jgi:hypothetical protein
MKLFRRRRAKLQTSTPEILTPNLKLSFMQNAVLSLLRHFLTFVGGTLVAKGILDSQALTEIIGAVITLISTGWMIAVKYKPQPPKP